MREKFENIITEEDLKEMERFFEIALLPDEPIVLNSGSQIINVSLFIRSHLSILKAQGSNKRYRPYLDRLIQLKHITNQNFNDNANQ